MPRISGSKMWRVGGFFPIFVGGFVMEKVQGVGVTVNARGSSGDSSNFREL